MSVADLLAEGRAAAEANMVDRCRIDHPTGETTLDDETGAVVEIFQDLYVGPCRIQLPGLTAGQDSDIGGQLVTLLRPSVQVPMTVVGVQVHDRVTMLAVAPESDPDLVGKEFRVADLFHKTHATARRLQCTEVTS